MKEKVFAIILSLALIHAPYKVPVFIVHLSALPSRRKAEITGLAEIQRYTAVCETELIRPLQLYRCFSHDLVFIGKCYCNFAGFSF
jgi:hypothetical protein